MSAVPAASHLKSFPTETGATPLIIVSLEGPLFIMEMIDHENRFDAVMCKAICDALDFVEETVDKQNMTQAALITRGQDKFYSNGLNFDRALTIPGFTEDIFMPMLNKILMFSLPTVACINGHAFAGGCLMAMAHDYRVMRSDRGFMSMNEIDLPSPLPAGMSALLRYKMHPHVYRDTVLQAKRFGGAEALACHLVEGIAEGVDKTFALAKEVAAKWAHKAKCGSIYTLIKEDMYPEASAYLLVGRAKL